VSVGDQVNHHLVELVAIGSDHGDVRHEVGLDAAVPLDSQDGSRCFCGFLRFIHAPLVRPTLRNVKDDGLAARLSPKTRATA
jgi:hypothetical protein